MLLTCAMGVAIPTWVHAAPSARDSAARTNYAYGSDEYDEHVHVRRGDTLEHILALKGLGPADAAQWLYAARGVYDMRHVKPKRGFYLRFDRASGQLESVRYEIDDRTLLTLQRRADGTVGAWREALPYFTEVRAVAGRIEQGLKYDTAAVGVPAQIASELVDIFGWDLDVGADLSPGDEFRIIYESSWEAGRSAPMGGKILGAQVVTRGQTLTAVLFEREDGTGGYYRPDGQALSRAFLRYPVEFREITSEFSGARYHPILHRWRPHQGVDLAAPRGTPVRAAADGWVVQAETMRGFGRMVRLEHSGGRATTYGHLNEIAASVHPGTQVERGQVIGYVGSSGLATGPHLHYEVEQGGVHLDPLQFNSELEAPVAPPVRRDFEKVRAVVTTQLARLPITDRPSAISLSALSFKTE
jgi:murein DD-endopeptidase MepM/ murein hydrolase activator NlpD